MAAQKLYPPYIERTIPAIYGDEIKVPFTMNPTVSLSSISGFALKIKTAQNSVLVGYIKSNGNTDLDNLIASFTLPDNVNLKVGQFYKVQLAYISKDNVVGHYSTVGILKYTTKPEVYIDGMQVGLTQNYNYEYVGVYSQLGQDTTEKVYSYRFRLFENGVAVVDSGYLIHHATDDAYSYESRDTFKFNYELDDTSSYKVSYEVITNNKLSISSPYYKVKKTDSFVSAFDNLKLTATLNKENAYVSLNLKLLNEWLSENNKEENKDFESSNGKQWIVKKDYQGTVESGNFIISKTDKSIKGVFTTVCYLTLQAQTESIGDIYRDFLIEQGHDYIYSLQQVNVSGLYSERVAMCDVHIDFTHSYLYDGKRQLKVEYNPDISSFKTDILEQKFDTIGNKYPFFFRNGVVSYKEFPISGLMSFQMDDENLFMNLNDLNLYSRIGTQEFPYTYFNGIDDEQYEKDLDNKNLILSMMNTEPLELKDKLNDFHANDFDWYNEGTFKFSHPTDLSDLNFYKERLFKLEILDWLNNGEPKLFKSAAEGNYLVRCMNTSLSPTKQISRMVHTFNTTAYEIGDASLSNLIDVGFYSPGSVINNKMRLTSDRVSNIKSYYDLNYEEMIEVKKTGKYSLMPKDILGNNIPIYGFQIKDVLPGTEFIVNDKSIYIGITGAYKINNIEPINSLYVRLWKESEQEEIDKLPEEEKINKINAILAGINAIYDYTFYSPGVSEFDELSSTTLVEHPIKQFIGENTTYIQTGRNKYELINRNIMNTLSDIKNEFDCFTSLHFQKRPIYPLYYIPHVTVSNVKVVDGEAIAEIKEVVSKDVEDFKFNTDNLDPVDYNEESGKYVYDESLFKDLYFDLNCKKPLNINDVESNFLPFAFYEIREVMPNTNGLFGDYLEYQYPQYERDLTRNYAYPSTGYLIDGKDHHIITTDKYNPTFWFNTGIKGETTIKWDDPAEGSGLNSKRKSLANTYEGIVIGNSDRSLVNEELINNLKNRYNIPEDGIINLSDEKYDIYKINLAIMEEYKIGLIENKMRAYDSMDGGNGTEYKYIDNITDIYLGNGIMLDCSYRAIRKNYNFTLTGVELPSDSEYENHSNGLNGKLKYISETEWLSKDDAQLDNLVKMWYNEYESYLKLIENKKNEFENQWGVVRND